MFAHAQILGNMVQDTEKKTAGNSEVAKNSIAWTTGYGEKKKSHFMDVEAWGKTAEVMKNFCNKGTRVLFDGALKSESWEDKNGARRTKYVLVVNDIVLLSDKQQVIPQSAPMPMQKMKSDDVIVDGFTGQVQMNYDELPF